MQLSTSFFLQKNNNVPMKKKKINNNIHSAEHYATRHYKTIYQFKVPLSANYLTISMVVGGLYLCSFQQHKIFLAKREVISKRRNSEFDLPVSERYF